MKMENETIINKPAERYCEMGRSQYVVTDGNFNLLPLEYSCLYRKDGNSWKQWKEKEKTFY